jgi:hypothetical protein
VKKEYDGRLNALYRSMGLLLIFVLTNLLNVPVNVQDMIIKSLTTVVFGYLMYVQTQLYAISPALVFIPYLILFLVGVAITVLMIRWFGCGNANNLLPLKEKIAASVQQNKKRSDMNVSVGEKQRKTADQTPILPPSTPSVSDNLRPLPESFNGNGKQHITRRQSVQMGVTLLRQANQQVKDRQESHLLAQLDQTLTSQPLQLKSVPGSASDISKMVEKNQESVRLNALVKEQEEEVDESDNMSLWSFVSGWHDSYDP